ncbi:hypothetical protein P3W45_001166 [Vairimorpha bombi]
MFFYCYNVGTYLPDTIYLYGRILDTENMNQIGECKSKQAKLTVYPVNSPILAVYNGNPPGMESLKKDLRDHFGEMNFLEEDVLKNIFYENLEKQIAVIRFIPKIPKSFKNFESKFCEKILYEFTNPLETFVISKKIKFPCVLKIKSSKTFIKIDDIEEVIRTNMPKLNYASFDVQLSNQEVISYGICINGLKYYSGIVKGKDKIFNDKRCQIEIHDNYPNLYRRIEQILLKEDIDCVIFFNMHGNFLKLFTKYIVCDMYMFASGNIKCRDFSVEELCIYYKIPLGNLQDHITVSKLIYEIFHKSDALILAKELSEISGYTLNKVLNNNRAEVIEYALFHDLYDKKYLLPPEIKQDSQKYVGGLVFEPKKDFYEHLVILLDFNSLYPSIIQEYNVCFSNINSQTTEKGVLPKILANLVQRRKAVKKLMAEAKDPKIYNTRQLALKILANSIYGCLGYPKSRFCNYKMASFITEKGREILQDTKNTIEDQLNLKVIYGDTDSIMINTELAYSPDNIKKSKEVAKKVINLINSKYKNIELDLEKIFFKLYLYAKKKYAGKFFDKNDEIREEYKGIDTVRRDVSLATVEILNKVLTILLDDSDQESNRNDIYLLLADEYEKLKIRETKDFVMSNILSKPLEKYASNIPLPYVQLCLRLKEKGIIYRSGDVVSFVIGKSNNDEPFYKRAFLPSEDFILDIDYYITHQILPSLNRILSLTKYANIEKLHKIFNIPFNKTYSTKSYKFKTNCCEFLQYPSKECKKCSKEIDEDLYLYEIQQMIRREVSALYDTKLVCKDCDALYDGIFLYCRFCSAELEFEIKNYEFDSFLDELSVSFSDIGYTKVTEYIKMHLNMSEFRVFDISVYFKSAIESYLRN